MRIGIDLGGTKIEGVALRHDGSEAARVRVATPPAYPALLQSVAAVVARLDQEAGATGTVGIGTPGFLQPGSGLIRNSNLTYLNDRPLDRDLAAAVGRPVRVANDAKCFVLSEATDGAGAPPPGLDRGRPDVVFGATLGTGVGGGLVVDGRVLTGENGSATEWSHTTLPFLRPDEQSPYACPCGHPGCIESFISGRGLEGAYRASRRRAELRGAEIARAGGCRRRLAREAFALYEDRLARALASVINMVDPRAIVLGGGVSNNARLFANVPPLLERYTVAKDLRTRIVPRRPRRRQRRSRRRLAMAAARSVAKKNGRPAEADLP